MLFRELFSYFSAQGHSEAASKQAAFYVSMLLIVTATWVFIELLIRLPDGG